MHIQMITKNSYENGNSYQDYDFFFSLFFTLYDYNNDNSDIKVIITVFFMSASFI